MRYALLITGRCFTANVEIFLLKRLAGSILHFTVYHLAELLTVLHNIHPWVRLFSGGVTELTLFTRLP